jgi:hypothetical protein
MSMASALPDAIDPHLCWLRVLSPGQTSLLRGAVTASTIAFTS